MKDLSKSIAVFFSSLNFIMLILFFQILVNFSVNCQEASSLQYLGNSFVKIVSSDGEVIYIDPYAVDQTDSADVILITHEHDDHNDLTRIIQKDSCKIYRVSNSFVNGVYQTFTKGNIKITAVPAYNKYHPVTDGVGFIVEIDGIKIYHAGGTGNIPEMAELTTKRIDYALYPVTPGPEIMTNAAAIVNAKHDIPIHSNVSLDRTPNHSLIERFTSPNKLVMDTDQTIVLNNQTFLTLRVPQTYSTIQSAINAAESGDTILVSEGTYYENINFRGKNIVVASNYIMTKNISSIENTIINGSQYANIDSASCVSFLNSEDSTAVLEGFTITEGRGTKYQWPNGNHDQEGAGIIFSYSNAIVRNNIIINNKCIPGSGTSAGGGGGISAMYGNPGIYNNLIISNYATYAAGLVLNWSGGKIKNNIIYNNSGGRSFGTGGVMIWDSPANSVNIENNIIIGNFSERDAGGLHIRSLSDEDNYIIKNNIIWYNRQLIGDQVSGDQNYLSYNNIEDYSEGTNISINPIFEENTFLLPDNSPLIDAGDPDEIYNDLEDISSSGSALFPSKGGLRNDIGAFGGPIANTLPSKKIENIIFSTNLLDVDIFNGLEKNIAIEILKIGFENGKIDSIINVDTASVKVQNNLNDKIIEGWGSDSIYISINPHSDGNYVDTLKVYHNLMDIENPKKIIIEIRKMTFTDVEKEDIEVTEFSLAQNFPNPFNPSTQITVSIPDRGNYTLKVYNLLGQNVATLLNDELSAGKYTFDFDASHLTSGIYFYKIRGNKFTDTKKMLLMK